MDRIRKVYNESCKEYNEWVKILDDTLYVLCKRYPNHSGFGEINAKIRIICRTFATGLERFIKKKKKKDTEQVLNEAIQYVKTNNNEVRSVFSKLKRINEPLTIDKLNDIVTLHGQFVELLSKIMRTNPGNSKKKPSVTSFVSKYMHFHCKAVPIYDNIVKNRLRSIVKWHSNYEDGFDCYKESDKNYYDYIVRFWQLYKYLKSKNVQPLSVRHVEYSIYYEKMYA